MTDRPRFTIHMTVRDNYTADEWHHAIACDQAMKVSERLVSEMKFGADISAPIVSADTAIKALRTKEMRRSALLCAATQLAGQLADLLEDSEGWHDPSRVEPAKAALSRHMAPARR